MKNVLIVDEDLGFVFWLGQALDAAGYEALPGRGVPEAIALLREFKVMIDILIVRAGLPGANALADHLRKSQGGLVKVIVLVDEGHEPTEPVAGWDGWQRKPQLSDENAKWNFLKLVQSVLAPGTAVSGG